MATPPMLQRREAAAPGGSVADRPDPAAGLAVILLGVTAVGLLLGSVLAVYDWTTPGAVRPLFFAALATFLAAVATLLLAATVRHARRVLR